MAFEEIKGITAKAVETLKAEGIGDFEEFLKAGATPSGRASLAKKLGVDNKVVLEWVNRADLARVKGIGNVYADLLEEAGVDTVKELAGRVPANLAAKILEINAQKKLTSRPPTAEMVEDWVAQAKALPKIVEY